MSAKEQQKDASKIEERAKSDLQMRLDELVKLLFEEPKLIIKTK